MRYLNSLVLVAIGFVLCLGNLWYAAVRSTIPVAINGEVTKVEIKHEKHPGRDDVYFVHLTSGDVVHVDDTIAKQLDAGCKIEKSAWDEKLEVQAEDVSEPPKSIGLAYSTDFWGMVYAMPLVFLTLLVTSIVARRSGNEPLRGSLLPEATD